MSDSDEKFYDRIIAGLSNFFDNVSRNILNNLFISSVVFIILLITILNVIYPNNFGIAINDNLNSILLLISGIFIIYVLAILGYKEYQYKNIKNFLEERKGKLKTIFNNIDSNNNKFIDRLSDIGSSNYTELINQSNLSTSGAESGVMSGAESGVMSGAESGAESGP